MEIFWLPAIVIAFFSVIGFNADRIQDYLNNRNLVVR